MGNFLSIIPVLKGSPFKIIVPISVTLLLSPILIFAQSKEEIPLLFKAAADVVNVNRMMTANPRLNNIIANPINKEVRYVQFSNLKAMNEAKAMEGTPYLRFSIAKGSKTASIDNVLAIPTHIETESGENYTYFADLVYGKEEKGHMVLIHEGEHSYGSIQLGNRHFRIESIEKDLQVLIESENTIINAHGACGVKGAALIKKDRSNQRTLNNNSTSCLGNNVRVLVMYTNRADAIANPVQAANTYIAETNSALLNSKIYPATLKFQLAGVRRITSWNETANIETDLGNLVTEDDLNSQRQAYHADLVVVLTDGNYFLGGFQILGIATLNDYSFPNTGHVAITEIDANGFTFGHEVGHLMGCRHDTDNRTYTTPVPNTLPPALSLTAKGHSWYYRTWFAGPKNYQKSMVADGGTLGSRVLYFSNPSVKSHDKARDNTGTSSRNNFVQLNNAASVVACYDPFDEMIVSISGPSQVVSNTDFALQANVSFCASATYLWEYSTNGYTYYTGSTSHRYITRLTTPVLFVRLKVTCSDGQEKYAHHTITEIDGGFYRLAAAEAKQEDDVLDLETITENTSQGQTMVVYPNPSSDIIFLETYDDVLEDVTVWMYNVLTGKKKAIFKGQLVQGNQQTPIDVSKLNQGLYQISVTKNGNELYGQRILIRR